MMIKIINHYRQFSSQTGSVMIALLIFIIVGTLVTSSAVMLMVDNTVISTAELTATEVHNMAESGAENAILRLLRDPSYTGETMIVGDGQVVVIVTGSEPIIVNSQASLASTQKTVEVELSRQNGVLTVNSWEAVE